MSDKEIMSALVDFVRTNGSGRFKYNKENRRIENGAGQLIDETALIPILNAVMSNAKKVDANV